MARRGWLDLWKQEMKEPHMDTERMVDELVRDEGMRLRVYTDSVGVATIGVGRNLRDTGITMEEAYHMLHNDLDRVQVDLDEHLPWWRNLDEVRQRVMVNLCFNLGIERLLGFHRTLTLIETHRYSEAATELSMSKWHQQVGERALRLEEMMRNGTPGNA